MAFALEKEWTLALEHLARAARDNTTFRCNLAYVLHQKGDREASQREYAEALRQDPTLSVKRSAEAYARLVRGNRNLDDISEGFLMATQACQATSFRDPRLLDTLAIAQAAVGDFVTARNTITKALALAEGQPVLLQQLREHSRYFEESRQVPLK